MYLNDLSLRIKESSSRHSNTQLFNHETRRCQHQYDKFSVGSRIVIMHQVRSQKSISLIEDESGCLLYPTQFCTSWKRSRRKATWSLKSAPSLATTKKISKGSTRQHLQNSMVFSEFHEVYSCQLFVLRHI